MSKNESFEKNGYLFIPRLVGIQRSLSSLPPEKGQYNYWDKNP